MMIDIALGIVFGGLGLLWILSLFSNSSYEGGEGIGIVGWGIILFVLWVIGGLVFHLW